jgi:hypothetical protein
MAAVSQYYTERPLIIDVPLLDSHWLKQVEMLGFAYQRSFTRMYLGDSKLPGLKELQYAIAGPEIG